MATILQQELEKLELSELVLLAELAELADLPELAEMPDLAELPQDVRSKLERYLAELHGEVDALKSRLVKLEASGALLSEEEPTSMSSTAVAKVVRPEMKRKEEIQRLQNETDKANKRSTNPERDNYRLELQVQACSLQASVLLMELEEARGNPVQRDDDVSSANITSSSEVKTQHLVTYRSIKELEEPIQKLLVALSELVEAKEKEEQKATASQISELRAFERAQSELKQLHHEEQHQLHKQESAIRQRDMDLLLAQTTGGVPLGM